MTKKMPDSKGSSQAAPSLRQKAEKKAKADNIKIRRSLSLEETRQVLHELRVHQIELEMQNEELSRAQEALEASQARYFDLYDLAPVGYFVLSEQGLILEANLTAATLLGEERGGLVKKPIARFILPEDQDIYYRHRKSLLETGAPQICELRMMRKDGALLWVRVESAAAQAADGGPISRVVISGITERKQAELLERTVYEIAHAADKAKNLDDLYQSVHLIIKDLMPAANFLIALYDENKNLVSFPYFVDEVDSAPPSRKPGKGLTDYVLRTGNALLCDAALEKELSRRGEVERIGTLSSCWLGVPLKAKDKTIGVIALDNYSDPKVYGERERKVLEYVSGQVANAIARKRAEETLQESLERFNLANRATFNAIWDWNLQTDALLWNENFQKLFGYRAGEIEPGIESWTNRIHPEDLDRVKASIHVVIVSGQDHWFDQYRFRRKDGMYAEVEDRGYVVRDAGGQPVRMIGAMQDITERIQSEKALQASLREKEILIREIHHRVKNNMQVISSLFNLQSEHVKDENARRMLKEGQLRIRSMALVHEKLYQSSDLSKIDFADYLRSLAEHLFQFFRVAADRIQLKMDLKDVSLDINSAVPCGLLVTELITNALKHAFPGDRKGVVGIRLQRGEAGTVELRVADDGVGFPKAVDFRCTESLGLQIVNLLVGQLEGTIELEKKKGTAFTISFRERANKAMT